MSQSGVLWALAVRTTASPAFYTLIAGLRTRSFKVQNNPIDATTASSSARWRELLGDTGTVELEIDASGLYQKDAPTHLLPTLASSGAVQNFILVSEISTPRGIEISGNFVVNEYENSAAYNEATTFTVKLKSVGQLNITYTPAASSPA